MADMSREPILAFKAGLAVRQLRLPDAASLAYHANDPEIARQLRDRFPSPYREEDATSFITMCSDPSGWRRAAPRMSSPHNPAGTSDDEELLPTTYAITLNDEVIGMVGFMFRSDIERRTAELGYWYV